MTTKSTFTFTINWETIFGTLFLAGLTIGFVAIMSHYFSWYNPTVGLGIFYIVEIYSRISQDNKDT